MAGVEPTRINVGDVAPAALLHSKLVAGERSAGSSFSVRACREALGI